MDCNQTDIFVKELDRMCCSIDCHTCPINENCIKEASAIFICDMSEVKDKVQEWSDANPLKTKQSEFLKLFPNAHLSKDGYISVCPNDVDTLFDCKTIDCDKCVKEFWSKPIE